MNLDELAARLEQFCADYCISKKHSGTIRLLSDMLYTLGMEPRDFDAHPLPRAMLPQDIGLDQTYDGAAGA